MKGKFQFLASLAVMLFTGVCANAQYVDENGVTYTAIQGSKSGNEGFADACDGNVNTKFGNFMGQQQYVVIQASQHVSINGYSIITANDNQQYPGRNPKSWTVEGSNDLQTWKVLDKVVDDNVMQNVNFTEFSFSIPQTAPFKYFKLNVTEAQGGDNIYLQFSEFHVAGTPVDNFLQIKGGFNADVVVEAMPVAEHLVLGIDNPMTGFYQNVVSNIVGVEDIRTDGMPANGEVVSLATGVKYEIDYTTQQTLQLAADGDAAGTLTLKAPVKAEQLYLLCNAGNGGAAGARFDVVVNYTDGTSEEAQSLVAPDWFNGGGNHDGEAIYGLQRVKRNATATSGFGEQAIIFVDRAVNCNPDKTVASLAFTFMNGTASDAMINIIGVSAGQNPVAVEGCNADVFGEALPFTETTDAPLDRNDYCVYVAGLVVGSRDVPANTEYAHGLPVNGRVVTKAGTVFYLDYAALNALRLGDTTNQGTIEVDNVKAAAVRVLATCGNGATNVKVTINYADGTQSEPVTITVPDWYRATTPNVAVEKLGRVYNGQFDDCENFYLFEEAIKANANKEIVSVTFEQASNPNGVPVIMGLAYDVPSGMMIEEANASADVLLPSKKWGGDYNAYVWSIKTEGYQGDRYNQIQGVPAQGEGGENWYEVAYNMADDWSIQAAPFTGWTDNDVMGDIYVRRYFTVNGTLPQTVYMPAPHDDAPAEYYINGVKVWSVTDGWNEDEIVRLTPEQIALIKTDGSVNVFAFHVHQNWGGYFADGGLYTAGDPVDAFANDSKVLDATIAIAEAEAVADADYAAALENVKSVNTRSEIGAALGQLRMARRIAMGGNHKNDGFVGTEPADGVRAYLYNVGTGLFMAGGNDWGTHASVAYAARPVILHANAYGDDCYSIQTELPNGARNVNDGLGHNGYVDCGGWNTNDRGWAWKFEAAGDGNYRIINCERDDNNKYFGVTPDERLQVDTDKAGADNPFNLWKLVTIEEREALAAEASYENPVDVTYYIHQSTFDQNDFDCDHKNDVNLQDANDGAWAGSAWERNAGSVWNWKGNSAGGDYVFEAWNTGAGDKHIYQTINVAPGVYRVSVTGYYRDGSFEHAADVAENPLRCAYLVANDKETLLPAITDCAGQNPGYGRVAANGLQFADGCYDAAKYFQMGLYRTSVLVTVANDGVLTLGAYKNREVEEYGDWLVVDNFRLEYLGDDVVMFAEYEAGDEPKVVLNTFGVATVFVDRYQEDKKITVLDGENVVAEVVAVEDNYKLENYFCDELTLTLNNALANGTYTLHIPAGLLVMGEDADVSYNSEAYDVELVVTGSDTAANGSTGINTVNTIANGKIYNIQGVEVKTMAQPDLYIVNGKKVLVK